MDTDSKNRIRIKARRFMKSEVFREDIDRGFSRKGEHLFHRLSMPFEKSLQIFDEVSKKVQNSPFAKDLSISQLNHFHDTQEFLFLYNAIFIAAPDPTRIITLREAMSFPEDKTFIVRLWQSMAGFIYLTIEKDPLGSNDLVGAIAGVGILPKYRGRKIGLYLIKHAIEFFKDKNVKQLICEVYHKNEASLKLFLGLGMEIVGDMILEEEQSKIRKSDDE